MPAQPPFFTPTRMPAIGRSDLPMMSRMRPAAASDSRITWGLGRGVGPGMAILPSPPSSALGPKRGLSLNVIISPHVQHHPRLVGHPARFPGRIPYHFDGYRPDAWNARRRIFHHAGKLLRGRAVRRGQGHVDGDGAIVADVDLVDQAELVDVGRDFGIVDRLER